MLRGDTRIEAAIESRAPFFRGFCNPLPPILTTPHPLILHILGVSNVRREGVFNIRGRGLVWGWREAGLEGRAEGLG